MIKNTFGERLKEERTRLGLTQEALGAVGGVKKLSQFTYEQDQRFPDAGYLIALAGIGVDVQYVMLGKPTVQTLSNEENELLSGFRKMDLRGKVSMLGMLDVVGNAPAERPVSATAPAIVNHGEVGQQITGGINAPQTFYMGSEKRADDKKSKKKLVK